MAEHTGADNVHTRTIAEFVSGLTYEQIPAEVRERIKLLILDSLGCAIYGANLEWCRILREHARGARCNAHDLDLGHRPSGCPRRMRRCSTARRCRASSSTTCIGKAVLHVGAVTLPALIAVAESHAQLSRPRFPHRRRRRLRDRAARRHVHGPGAYRPGLAFRRDGRGVLGRRRRGARAAARCRADRACARHRRHAVGRPDGGAIRRHGQAHACRPRGAERALRRAAWRRTASPASSTCSRRPMAASAPRSRARTIASISTS